MNKKELTAILREYRKKRVDNPNDYFRERMKDFGYRTKTDPDCDPTVAKANEEDLIEHTVYRTDIIKKGRRSFVFALVIQNAPEYEQCEFILFQAMYHCTDVMGRTRTVINRLLMGRKIG